MRFVDEHLSVLKVAKDSPPPPWPGKVPVDWYDRILKSEESRPSSSILKALKEVGSCRLTRETLRDVCRTTKNVLVAYICTMAWGGQGTGKAIKHAQQAWSYRKAPSESP